MNSSILRKLIDHGKITEVELATRSGVPQATINRLTRIGSHNPRVSTLSKLAEYFNITIGQLSGQEPLFDEGDKQHLLKISKIPVLSWEEVPSVADILQSGAWNNWTITTAIISKSSYAVKIFNRSFYPTFPYNTILIVDPNKIANDNNYIIISRGLKKETTVKKMIIRGNEKWLLDPNMEICETLLSDTCVYYGVVVKVDIPINN